MILARRKFLIGALAAPAIIRPAKASSFLLPTQMLLTTSGAAPVVPTTFDPSKKGAACTLSGGNLTATMSGGLGGIVLTITSRVDGKVYFEVARAAAGATTPFVGFGTVATPLGVSILGGTAASWGFNGFTGNADHNGGSVAYGSSWFGSAVTIGVAIDFGAGKAWFAIGNTYQNSGNPVTGTNPAFTGISGTIYAAVSGNDATPLIANFGSSAMTFSPPTGYTAGFGS